MVITEATVVSGMVAAILQLLTLARHEAAFAILRQRMSRRHPDQTPATNLHLCMKAVAVSEEAAAARHPAAVSAVDPAAQAVEA